MENENKNVVVDIPQKKKESKIRIIGKIILRIFIFISLVILDLISIYSCKVQQEYQSLVNGSENTAYVNRNNNYRKNANEITNVIDLTNLLADNTLFTCDIVNYNGNTIQNDFNSTLENQFLTFSVDEDNYLIMQVNGDNTNLRNYMRQNVQTGYSMYLNYIYIKPLGLIDNSFYNLNFSSDSSVFNNNNLNFQVNTHNDCFLSCYVDDGVWYYPYNQFTNSSLYNVSYTYFYSNSSDSSLDYYIELCPNVNSNLIGYELDSLFLDGYKTTYKLCKIELVNAYFNTNSIYSQGVNNYENGYKDASREYQDTINNLNESIKSITNSYRGMTYEQIFNAGKQEGMQTVQQGDLNNLFKTTAVMVFNAPYNILHNVFNFSFLGINLFSLFSFLITCSIVLFIIKMFKK